MKKKRRPIWIVLVIVLGSLMLLGLQDMEIKQTFDAAPTSARNHSLGGVLLDIRWIAIGNYGGSSWQQNVAIGERISVSIGFTNEGGLGHGVGYGSGVNIGSHVPGTIAQTDTTGFWAIKWVVVAIFDGAPDCTLSLRINEYNLSGMITGIQPSTGTSISEPVTTGWVGGYGVVFENGETYVFDDYGSTPQLLIHRHFVLDHRWYPSITGCAADSTE